MKSLNREGEFFSKEGIVGPTEITQQSLGQLYHPQWAKGQAGESVLPSGLRCHEKPITLRNITMEQKKKQTNKKKNTLKNYYNFRVSIIVFKQYLIEAAVNGFLMKSG